MRNHTRLFRALLYFYPSEFRHEYGAEMEQLFTDRLQTEPRWLLWLESLADVASTAPNEHWQILLSDLKYGARALAAAPGFTTIALLVIALGIGATVSIFSLVNAVLLRSLPYGHSNELVYLWSPNSNFKGVPDELGPNVPDFYDWQRASHSFSDMAMFRPHAASLVRNGSSRRLGAAFVTGTFFQTLQATPARGRTIQAADDQPGRDRAAVISDALAQSEFASPAAALGKTIQCNRQTYSIVGIMPKDFGYPFAGDVPYENTGFQQTDIWLPAAYTPGQKSNRTNFDDADAIARLKPGVSAHAAETELVSIQRGLDHLYPPTWRGFTAQVRPLVETIIGPVEKMLWLLLGAVGIVLLVAISNMANLLLARASARAHELGIRTALGAARSRIIRQLLTESLLLSGIGGVIGIAFAYAAVRLLTLVNPGNIPRFDAARVDGRVLLVAVLLSLATGFISGMVPAIAASNTSITNLLRKGGSRTGGTSNKWRFALIVLEVALSVILLTGSGLLIRSYLELARVAPGFSTSTLTFKVSLDHRYNTRPVRTAFLKRYLESLRSVPGVRYAGASNSLPLSNSESVAFANIRGFGASREMLETRSVTPDYRKALGTPLLRGRDFEPTDVNSKAPVMIVNQSFVDKFYHGRDPLGGHVSIGIGDFSTASWSTIVGVVGNIRHSKLEEDSQPQIFHVTDGEDGFAIQCSGPVDPVVQAARAILRSMDPALALDSVRTMRERVDESNGRRRFQTGLLTGFAAIAVVMALAGLYGLMSYSVKQRKSEMGIRLAVGSSRSAVVRLILWQGMRLTACGLLIGLAGAYLLSSLVKSWLFEVTALDPATFLSVPLLVLAVACAACIIPAWNAARIDPIEALREE
jgi:putative ABC transport system permease protein